MSLVGTGFSYDPQLRQRQALVLATLMPQIRDVRRFGSAALDLCMVAAGQLDAYYEENLNVWDWAAGALIAAEAGALVRVPSASGELIVAAAPGVEAALTDALRGSGDRWIAK
jgi:myo-inositol-1(or 4)-monophosphatase